MNTRYLFIILLLSSFVTGCASTGGSYKLLTPPMSDAKASQYSDLQVSVKPKPSVNLAQFDADRITGQIIKQVKEDGKNRFKSINSSSQGPGLLQASVEVKQYEEGNAFARFMLAGLGQIHIDADVTLSDFTTREKLAQYEVSKTFAWGGIYGGSTNIKDVETGFSKAVADSILGKD